jgi:hypothetical protein
MTSGRYRAKVAAPMGMVLAALVLTAGCASTGSSATTTSSSTRPATNATTASAQAPTALSSTTLAGLTRLADQAAGAQGAMARSAVAVRTTRRAANLAMGGDVVNTDPGESVWAIAVVTKAPVVCRTCSYAPGAKPPQGTVITLVADATSLKIMDAGLSDETPHLAALGTPVPLPV